MTSAWRMRQRPHVTPGTIKCVHITHPVITRQPNPGNTLSPSTATVSVISHFSLYLIINVPLISDDCCVKVSAHQLLNHWLNDHKDPEPMGNNNHQEVLHIVNCQNPESSLSAALARLQSTESTGKSRAFNNLYAPSPCPWTPPHPSSFSLIL